jgi:hypothetical protein
MILASGLTTPFLGGDKAPRQMAPGQKESNTEVEKGVIEADLV